MTNQNIIQVDLVEDIEQSFLDYAMSVITDRAIPDITGLKPVHRRILYSAYELGLTNNKPHKKSARIVGEVIAKWHPHGDSSVYDAMVRMAQDFSMRYPLIDGQGNMGTIDGDPAAASRYTEARLSKIAFEMLRDINKNVVNTKPNFSDDEQEPVILPSRIPNLLLNGTTGIGVSLACSFPPHHLGSTIDMIINRLNSTHNTVEELLKDLQGPDFPTGGVIINKNELLEGYKTGRGRVRVRGKYTVEPRSKNTENLIFTEIPYGVNKEKLITDIAKLCESKEIEGITDLRDESNREGIRIVIELKKDINPDVMANILFSKTQLENTFSMNFTCLVNGEPKVLNLLQIVDEYIKHQKDVIKRRTEFDLNKVQSRLHILEGLLKALENIDNVIKIIKSSSNSAEARRTLEGLYNFSETQSKSILDMKLSKLTGLEKIEIEQETSKLKETEEELLTILNNEQALISLLNSELSEIKNQYNDNRRTEIIQINKNNVEKDIEFVQPEEVVVVMSKNGNIKKIPAKSFKIQKKSGKGIKNHEDLILDAIKTNTIDTLMFFTNMGKVYRLLVDDVPTGTNAAKGTSIKTLVKFESGEEVLAFTSLNRKTNAQYAIFTTKLGMIKKTHISEYTSNKRSSIGVQAITLKENDSLSGITFLGEEQVLLLTKKGKSLRFETNKITPVGRKGMGVIAMKLDEGDEIVSCIPILNDNDNVAIFSTRGLGKQVLLKDYPVQSRGGKGTITYKPTDSSGEVIGGVLINNTDNLLLVGNNSTIAISASEVPQLSKTALGNILMKDNELISIIKL